MSRRAPSTSRASGSRAPSLAMPPPQKIPTRPASVSSTIRNSHSDVDGMESRPASRRGTSIMGGSSSGVGASSLAMVTGHSVGEINIQVVVRCRGRSTQEIAQESPVITTAMAPLSDTITIDTPAQASSSSSSSAAGSSSYGASGAPAPKTYRFDKVFGPAADQSMVFREAAESMLDQVLAGYNCTILAYGQTGTGKTFTMQGDLNLTPLMAPSTEAGIIPRVLHRLFALLDAKENSEYAVTCSYLELYNEELRDLLAPEYKDGSGGQGLKIVDDGSKKGVSIQGAMEAGVRNLQEGLALLQKGSRRRQTAETKMNSESSRSHSMFILTVRIKEDEDEKCRIGKFNLVDLAGSEAIGRSGAENQRAREAGKINKSLLALGRVIHALVDKNSHIPYRDSQLTSLLKDSLGGRTKTCIVATVSPTRSNMEETMSTLDYANRAKSIKNKPEINGHQTVASLLRELLAVKDELISTRGKTGRFIPEDQWEEIVKQKSECTEAKQQVTVAQVRLTTLEKEYDELTTMVMAKSSELDRAQERIRQLDAAIVARDVQLGSAKVALEEEEIVSQAYERGEQRLDGVADGLRTVAIESVRDVGSLFEKLDRTEKVFDLNARTAHQYGTKLKTISSGLEAEIMTLRNVQHESGTTLRSVMEAYSVHGNDEANRELASLDSAMKGYRDQAKSLARSIEKGKVESAEVVKSTLEGVNAIHDLTRQWVQGMSVRNASMVQGILSHHQQYLTEVDLAFESTTTLVSSLLVAAQDTLAEQTAIFNKAEQISSQAAEGEMSRLRAQNSNLSQLVQDQQRSRAAFVQDMTDRINGFADAQGTSLSQAVGRLRSDNDVGSSEMGTASEAHSSVVAEGLARIATFDTDLVARGSSLHQQSQAGRMALEEVSTATRTRLEEFATEMDVETERHVKSVDKHCSRLSTTLSKVGSSAIERAHKQVDIVTALGKNVGDSYALSRTRVNGMTDRVASLTATLFASHDTSSTNSDRAHSLAQSSLDAILASTSTFLDEGIQNTTTTGATPRKRSWNVAQEWERTGSRSSIVDEFRRQRARGIMPKPESITDGDDIANDTSRSIVPVSSSISLDSSTSADEGLLLPTTTGSEKWSAPLTSTSLSVSQIRPPRAKAALGKSGAVTSTAGDFDRPVLSVLGEGGNVPRRAARR